jgi:BA14K-like protein
MEGNIMKFYTLSLFAAAMLFAIAPHAFASKADYCSVYAHDFADGHSQDKAVWQHKYEIAMTDCLGETSTAETASTPRTKTVVKAKKIEQKVASVQTKTAKQTQPAPASSATQTKLQPGSEAWNNYCTNKYASFNTKTGTYTSKTGVARKCVVFYP